MGKTRGRPDRPGADEPKKLDADEKAFIATLIANGQAAEADEKGDLPPGATHEITGYRPDGLPILVRRSFSGG